jgi:hypothetical protein
MKALSGIFSGQANKFLVAVLGAIGTSLSAYFGDARWEPMVFGIVTALATYIIPNLKLCSGARQPSSRSSGR